MSSDVVTPDRIGEKTWPWSRQSAGGLVYLCLTVAPTPVDWSGFPRKTGDSSSVRISDVEGLIRQKSNAINELIN